jgi:8-oxo-dGTP diphosphatase
MKNNMERFKLASTANVIFIKDGTVLLLRRFNTGWNDGYYDFVAGHLEKGERVFDAACREALEETGLVITENDLSLVHILHRVKDEKISFFFAAKSWKGEPENKEPDKCDEVVWHSLVNLPDNIVPHVRQVLEKYQQGITFSEA